MHFRWRDNAGIIAQYILDSKIPRAAEVTLKPNEVCVILEDGRVVGSVSQQHMEVSPQVGAFGKLFGRSNPKRSFMFAFTGPHLILIQVRGMSNDGEEINCLLNLKLEITRESAPRLLTFPAKGTLTVNSMVISDLISSQANSAAVQFLSHLSSNEMRTTEISEDLIFHIRNALKQTLEENGLLFRNGFVTWSMSLAEKQLQQQAEINRLKIETAQDSEKQEIELNHMIESEQRKHEIRARMALVGISAEESAKMKLDLERLERSATIDFEKYRKDLALSEFKAEAARSNALKDAETNVELARLESERQKALGQFEMEKSQQKKVQAMEMFEQVQARKRERMQMKAEQEQQRLEKHSEASKNTISVLENIAASSKDPAVQLEALKQLAELRKADVEGQKDAYTDN